MRQAPQPPPDDTRSRLLQASLAAFSQHDFDSVSVRTIVEAADANIAAVSYHFGGKQGLYLATAEFLAEQLHTGIAPLLDDINLALETESANPPDTLLAMLINGLVHNLLGDDADPNPSGFIMREQLQPTAAFDVLFDRLMRPIHETIEALAVRISGDQQTARSRVLMTHALVGQILVFRFAQATMLRRLNQSRFTPSDIDEIALQVQTLTLNALKPAHGESRHD